MRQIVYDEKNHVMNQIVYDEKNNIKEIDGTANHLPKDSELSDYATHNDIERSQNRHTGIPSRYYYNMVY